MLAGMRLALLASAAFGVLALGTAEVEFRRDTPEAVRCAASLGASRYDVRLAEFEPERARDILRKALRADPRAASVWISLGLLEERVAEENSRTASARKKRMPEGSRAGMGAPAQRDARNRAKYDHFEGFRGAREAFETAYRVDGQYAPAWALANFCFRRGDQDCFWRAASRAVARAPLWASAPADGVFSLTDLGPIVDLASRMDSSPIRVLDRLAGGIADVGRPAMWGTILQRNISETTLGAIFAVSAAPPGASDAYPGRLPYATPVSIIAPLERAYLDELIDNERIGQSRWDDAEMVARRVSGELVRSGEPDALQTPSRARQAAADTARLDDFVTRLIDAGRPQAAVDLWNEYAGFAPLSPDRGFSLTNGDFARQPRNTGFDWRLHFGPPFLGGDRRSASANEAGASDGIATLWTPSQLEFRFSGGELEQCQLAEQWLPLVPRSYRLRFEYETRDLPSPTGFHWEIGDRYASNSATTLVAAADWRAAQWDFSGVERLAPLRLVYRRAPGTVRGRGSFLVRHVRLEVL